MRPMNTLINSGDLISCNSINSTKMGIEPSIILQFSNLYNILFGYNSLSIFFAGTFNVLISTFFDHILNVFILGSYKKMLDIYTQGVITGVANIHFIWNLTKFKFIKISAYSYRLFSKFNSGISVVFRSLMRCAYIAPSVTFNKPYRPSLFACCHGIKSLIEIPGVGRVCEKLPRFNDKINRVKFCGVSQTLLII